MGKLTEIWPKGQFVITGVLGPAANAHGPNEMLNLPYVKKLICCMSLILAKVSKHFLK
jgi:acetylornithine deacetylase/succinyl-diaminopimelate desuccinylase-like protein